jgi:hypothetical protein
VVFEWRRGEERYDAKGMVVRDARFLLPTLYAAVAVWQ